MRPDLDAEIRHHVQERADRLVEEGWEADAALREAQRRFGDVVRVRSELARIDGTTGGWTMGGEKMWGFWQDLRHALRGLRKSPGFALAVVATLALGIGAAASIFAVVDALLLRPLDYRDADRLVQIDQAERGGAYINGLSVPAALQWRDLASGFTDGWLAYLPETRVRTDGRQAEALHVLGVTPGADTLLGLPLLMGRSFTRADAVPSGPQVAILGRSYFERLGGDAALLGSTIHLQSGPVTVVGVLREGMKFPIWGDVPDLWLPMRTDGTVADQKLPSYHRPLVWARLRPGLDAAGAQQRADALAASLDAERPKENGTWRVHVGPVGAHRVNSDVRQALWILGATVALIFLIALMNGVNLLLVRTSGRVRELAVRQALGGTRRRLLGQLLVEGLLLGLGGGAAAAAVAWGAVGLIRGILPNEVTYFSPYPSIVGARTLIFAFVVALLAGLFLGLVPGIEILRGGRTSASLAGRSAGDTRAGHRTRSLLVGLQVALSMTLLTAAGLFVKSVERLVHVDPGYDFKRIALADLSLSAVRYPTTTDRAAFVNRLAARLEREPGVRGVTFTDGAGFGVGNEIRAEDSPPPTGQPALIPFSVVRPDYFRVMGVDIVAGRGFQKGDAGTDVAVIDEDMAHYLWGDGDPVGKRFTVVGWKTWYTVVGVVRELRLMGRDQRSGPDQFLLPGSVDSAGTYVSLAVRTDRDPASLLPEIRRAVRAVDPQQPIYKLQTAAQHLATDEQKPRFLVTLMGLLAAIAVTLACVGLYGMLSYSVSRRDRELGIRMALGAGRGGVRAMVLGEGLRVATLGILAGVLGALLASKAVAALLYDVGPRDPEVLLSTGVLFLLVAAAASFMPARRATHVDPVEVLKAE